tara:strand:+ start:143 stop:463 length:321 start_codon:yes stop_codon:yes gene_type:complete
LANYYLGDLDGDINDIRSSNWTNTPNFCTMRIPQRVPLQTPLKQLRVSRVNDTWQIWLAANRDFTLGSFLQLCDDSIINIVTWHEDGTETVYQIADCLNDSTYTHV